VIARIWHGYAKPEHADTYEAMPKPKLLPGIRKGSGYRGSYLLRRRAGNEFEFIANYWSTRFAVVPDEREQYLSHYDANAATCEIASM
jgi:hypothetical protein